MYGHYIINYFIWVNVMHLTVIYPGTFDPITLGHLDLIRRASKLFPHIIVAVAESAGKKPLFPLTERIHLVRQSVQEIVQVTVTGFNALLVDFAKEKNALVILRGVRALGDFEFECQLAGMNRKLMPELETVFLTPSEEVMMISSSLVKEIALMGGDVSAFVPKDVLRALVSRLE
jgi:pantetheine-phosphate adenylyltransferase